MVGGREGEKGREEGSARAYTHREWLVRGQGGGWRDRTGVI